VTTGLVASALEQELLGELRRRGIVVWLDSTGAYSEFVDGLRVGSQSGDFPFPVVAFRGSLLELVIALENYASGLDSTPLLIHMPGFTRESIRKTPVLELYEPGLPFLKAPETLVREVARGRAAPDALEQFLAKGMPSLGEADAWLSAQLTTTREGLAGLLEQNGVKVVIDAAVDLLTGRESFLKARVSTTPELEVLEAWFGRQTGMDTGWIKFFGGDGKNPLADICTALIGWLLCVEYVHDLGRPPHLAELARLRELSPPLVKSCIELVQYVRQNFGDAYATLADEVELHLHQELPEIRPEDLGKVDTFRNEEQRVFRGALQGLRDDQWEKVRAWADARTEEQSFWLKRDAARRLAWSLVREAATLGTTLAAHPQPLDGIQTLDAAVDRYRSTLFAVDRAHRRFEQLQAKQLDSQLPEFGELKEIVRLLRAKYRIWADGLARAFAAICSKGGFLPDPSLQQRALFEQIVLPLAADEKVAYLLLDAFRYEMATELVEGLKAAGTVVDLKARLAELPTITAVGMNLLAPVSQGGRLQVSGTFGGFKAGEFTVRTPKDRVRAIGLRSGGKQSLLLKVSEVCDAETESLKRKIRDARVVVVHGTEFDDAGEANVGPLTFENTLQQIRTAYAQLQKAGVKSFVFTADHGFLLLDETTQRVPFGTARDPKQRYVLDPNARAEQGMVNVSLSALGYDGLAGYLLFREDTAVFTTGNSGATFVHGGNSMQERVIPVLTVTRSRVAGRAHSAYQVEAVREKDVMGVRRIRLRLRLAGGQLGFTNAKAVSLALRAVGASEVRPVLKDVNGLGTLQDAMLRIAVGDDWSELCFALEGPSSDKVRVEVFHPDGVEQVEKCELADWFEVDWRRGTPEPIVATADRVLDWLDALSDEGVRSVFRHLANHGSVTESEVIGFVGSARAFRRFSLDFDEHARKVPFRVRIEPGADGKRYVKEGEK